ncbi:MAG TPA: hypothetical protein VFR68_08860 [Candidatus Dormibacteraeota bacterium]|nr:hypothetical protein [Candidatus Dormibacteraeota bacterium]
MSFVLPILILVLVAVTGFTALPVASRRHQRSAWPLAIGVTTLLSVFGPIVSLLVFRDSPDQFIPVATVLAGLLPVVALAYAVVEGRSSRAAR